jgi:hypothetical protein
MKVDIELDHDYDPGYRMKPNSGGVEVPDELLERYRQLEAAYEQLGEQAQGMYAELKPYVEQMYAIDHRREAKKKLEWQAGVIERDYPEITRDELRRML